MSQSKQAHLWTSTIPLPKQAKIRSRASNEIAAEHEDNAYQDINLSATVHQQKQTLVQDSAMLSRQEAT